MITVIFICIVIILLVALAIWGISLLTAIPVLPRQILMALCVLVGIYFIATKVGLA